jgi:hypothetical protein
LQWLHVIEEYEVDIACKEAWAHELAEAGMNISEIISCLDDAWYKLQEARAIVEETPDLVEPIISEVNEIINYVHGKLVGLEEELGLIQHQTLVCEWLQIIEDYESEANQLEDRAHALASKDVNVSEVYDLIEEAWRLLVEARAIVEDTPELVEPIIAEVNQLLDQAIVILTELESTT